MKNLKYFLMTLAALMIATPVFAQDGGAASQAGLISIAAGIGMAIAAGLCGLAQGKATASAAEALARNPGARPGIFTFLILGLAFIESLASVHLRDHLHQGRQVSFVSQITRKALADARAFLRPFSPGRAGKAR